MRFESPLTARSVTFHDGELHIEPFLSSSPIDYNFLLGTYLVHHKKIKTEIK